MVLLTVTPAIATGLQKWTTLSPDEPLGRADADPSLDEPAVGDPISHGQIVDLWRKLQAKGCDDISLETLLRGSRVFIPAPPSKPEPSDEYKALMARLRRDEDARAYSRMLRAAPATETFSDVFPSAKAFAAANRPHRDADVGEDSVTLEDVHRQMMLILNFLLSILGAGAALWMLGRWWSTPARLFLAMGGSAVVGAAEFGVYYFYMWHLRDESKKEKKVKEFKEVVQTWVVEKSPDTAIGETRLDSKESPGKVRRRRKE